MSNLFKKEDKENNIYKAIKYRIYPNEKQIKQIAQTFGCTRKVYNIALELQQGLYAAEMKTMTATDLNNYCNRFLKKDYTYLEEVDKFSITNSLIDLTTAFKNFFEGNCGYPKFKSKKDSCKSYSTNMANNNIAINKSAVKLPKLGWVAAKIHRQPFADGKIKSATISQNARGNYFVSILFELQNITFQVIPTIEKTLGLDYSSPHFYVASDKTIADAPHWYRQAENRLAKEQRKLSRMVKGSNNYEEQKRRIAKLYELVANQRRDFCHKLSREIANSYDVVCVEDINLQALAKSLRFGKATNDNGFGMFRNFLKYKLEEQGKFYVVIDKWYPSSKTCHHCGTINTSLKLGESVWVCEHCHNIIDRDYNASLNIRDEGFRQLKEYLHSLSLVEAVVTT